MKKNYRSTRIKGKLKVYRYLIENNEIRRHLPYTCSFTESNLRKALNNYATLYIKPDYGKQGKGIYKVTINKYAYRLQYSGYSKVFTQISSLYRYIKKRSRQALIIQRGINLEKVQGKPYDIRAMVQRKPMGAWLCTGIFAKVGSPNSIVTNYSQGGRISLMRKLYGQKGLSSNEQNIRLKDIERLVLKVARSLSTKKAGMHQMGVDVAYDQNGKLWILEVNTNWPAFYPLRKLDPSMYNRMLSIAKSYGRYSS